MKSKIKFKKLTKAVKSCKKCRGLNVPKHTMSAIGSGTITGNPVMLIGQSLHSYNPETPRKQLPFVGPSNVYDSGDVLFEAIHESNAEPDQVYITNAVKCHPPGNRHSTPEEVMNCLSYLKTEIRLIRPSLIVILGNGTAVSLKKLGAIIKDEPTKCNVAGVQTFVVKVYHPAYFNYRRAPKQKRKWFSNLVEVINDYSSL